MENDDSLFPFYWPLWTNTYSNEIQNTSLIPYPKPIWIVKPTAEIIIKTGIMVPIAFIGISLNLIIILVIWKNKHLWSSSNYLIANLAVSDLLTLLFSPWFMLLRDFFQNYLFQSIGCRLEGFVQSLFVLSGISAVVLVAYDRMALVALTADARITKTTAPRIIVISWITSFCLAIPWIVLRKFWQRQWLDYLEVFCTVHNDALEVYWYLVVIVIVWLPLVILVATYGTILWRLNKSRKYLNYRGGSKFIARARARAMKISACVLVAATICRIPYTVAIYYKSITKQIEITYHDQPSFGVMWYIANFFLYLDCAINPLIYGFTNERYKRAMDVTPGLACFNFGAWCCICISDIPPPNNYCQERNNKNNIFVISHSPKATNVRNIMNNILNKDNFHIEQSTSDTRQTESEDTNL